MDLNEITEFLVELSELAAAQTLPRFRQGNTVENKSSGGFDPVTEADRKAEQAIRARILDRFPDHGIEGEEFGSFQSNSRWRWVIDPIDGTRAFLSGIPVWGTLIGFCRDEVPIAGIMSQPYTGELFIASNGVSRFRRGDHEQVLESSDTTTLDEAILMSTSPDLFSSDEKHRFEALVQKCRMVRFGTDCYAYCMLAAGQVDLVVESGLSFYDIAALIPLIENSGGVITGWDGRAFDFTGTVIAAATPALHEKAMRILIG